MADQRFEAAASGSSVRTARIALAAFVVLCQASVSGEPGHGAFDDPAVSPEFLVGVDAFVGDADFDALITDPRSEVGVVVGFVGVQLRGHVSAWAAPGPGRGMP
jgi:hypothetical protein